MPNVVTPADIPLPAFLDPLLTYLSDNLPQPAYSVLISFLSHALALISALLTLIRSLIFDSDNWNAQTLLPPLIAFLSAYFAIISLYRTTTWMLRTSLWFIKWGTLLAAVAAGVGWIMGSGGNTLTGRTVANNMAGWVLDMVHENGKNTRQRSSSHTKKRPKPWDSFQAHRDWQYQETRDEEASENNVKVLFDNILSTAGSVIKESNWWGVFNGDSNSEKENKDSESVSR
jgi:hypothetical protein